METLSALLALCEGNPCGDQRTVLSLIANALETLQSCTALSHQLLQLDIKQFKFIFLAQPSMITHTTENWQPSWCQLCCHWWHQRLLLRQPLVPPVTTKLASWWLRIHSESWRCQLCNPTHRTGNCYYDNPSVPVTTKSPSWWLSKSLPVFLHYGS